MLVICPACGEDESLSVWPALDDGRRPTACEACGHQWVRDAAPDWRPSRTHRTFVTVADLDVDAIREAAWRIAQEWQAQGSSLPLRDLILRHGIGQYGEHAVAQHLIQHGLASRSIGENAAAIRDRLGDIEVAPPDGGRRVVRLEVKCTTPRGRLAQIPPMNADAAVWCVVGYSAQTVQLIGWSPLPLDDPLQPHLRDAATLVSWIRGLWAG